MSDDYSPQAPPEAQVRMGRGFSIIWVVPIIALLIGGGLFYKALQEKGPVITITFPDAEGLEAGKTAIKFKDVEVGKVAGIALLPDLSGVEVTAEMKHSSEAYLTDKTQFWVVRARVAAGEVSGLGTLFSGAYIGCSPSKEGLAQRSFKGLVKPPVLTTGMPGRHFVLVARNLGSLDIGSPVYYRGIKVGQVVDYEFDEAKDAVLIRVFVHAPYHDKVFAKTRFWNAGGIDLSLDATGVKINTQSLVSIMLGGIAFDLQEYAQPGETARDDAQFKLYEDHDSSKQESYAVKTYYLMYFDESVRGLSPGAPVEIKGIKIGEVVRIELLYDQQKYDFSIPVLVMIEPERMNALITDKGNVLRGEKMEASIEDNFTDTHGVMRPQRLVDKGMRAQLKTGNLLTGQLYIDLDFHEKVEPVKLRIENGYVVFPTVAQPFERILQRVENILGQFEKVKFGDLGSDLKGTMNEIQLLLKSIRTITEDLGQKTMPQVNTETLPRLNGAISDLRRTLEGMDQTLGPDSALNYNVQRLSEEFVMTIRSLRSLVDYLERDPQALILGKEGEKK